jgi:hypothetical protein
MNVKLSPEIPVPIIFENGAGIKDVQLSDVQRVPDHPELLQWNVTNNIADSDIWIAPVASFSDQSSPPSHYTNDSDSIAVATYEMNATGV